MLFRTFLFICFSFFGLSSTSQGQFEQQPTFLPVEQAYQLSSLLSQSEEGQQQVEFNWQIAAGYYLYRHSFKFELTDRETQNVPAFDINIEEGLAKHDEYFGDVEVYYFNSLVTLSSIPPGQYFLTVTSQGCADAGLCYPPRKQYFELDTQQHNISERTTPPIALEPAANTLINNTQKGSKDSLLYIILLAILGGSILNLMPCVFPVLSLKILSFTHHPRHRQSLHGLVYSCGVVLSFTAVAALLISLQAAGEAIGWGFQLQNPWFVAALAYLFFIMGLSLSGYIELGQNWMGLGSSLANRSGYSGSFFTGVLATVVASPCTAPFMGTALGYAITQDTLTALSVFVALGFGMALPVLWLSHSPRLLNKLPKPGPWMEQLKQFLAFPLFATTLWLSWVIGRQTGVNGMLVMMTGCLLIALTIWLWGRRWQRKLLAALTIVAIAWLHSSSNFSESSNTDNNWQTYSPAALTKLRNQQQLIFINLTADWCITCLANEKITLNTEEVKRSFKEHNVHYLKGDWTHRDPVISDLLKQHGRTGIPLYLLYPAGKNSDAIVLPQILSKQYLLEKVAQFAAKAA